MTVTELALLQYKSPPSITSSLSPIPDTVVRGLRHAAREQTSFSRYPVALLQCHEDLSLVYLVGGWETVEQHMNEWIPGQTNQELMKVLGKDMDVKWMFHLDVDPADVVTRLVKSARGSGIEGKDGVVAIGRHFVKESQHDVATATFKGNLDALEDFLGGASKRKGGWRVDRGFVGDPANDAEDDVVPTEFVLFTAWNSVEGHLNFAKTEDSQRYTKLRDHVEGAEIRHGTVFHIGEL